MNGCGTFNDGLQAHALALASASQGLKQVPSSLFYVIYVFPILSLSFSHAPSAF
jgi:hypothetical protein